MREFGANREGEEECVGRRVRGGAGDATGARDGRACWEGELELAEPMMRGMVMASGRCEECRNERGELTSCWWKVDASVL